MRSELNTSVMEYSFIVLLDKLKLASIDEDDGVLCYIEQCVQSFRMLMEYIND